jgi:hypothetical protein
MLAGVTFCWHLSPLADREDYAVIERSGEFTKTHASKGGRSILVHYGQVAGLGKA